MTDVVPVVVVTRHAVERARERLAIARGLSDREVDTAISRLAGRAVVEGEALYGRADGSECIAVDGVVVCLKREAGTHGGLVRVLTVFRRDRVPRLDLELAEMRRSDEARVASRQRTTRAAERVYMEAGRDILGTGLGGGA